MVAIAVVPLKAVREPRDGRARRKEHVAPKMTVRTGDLKRRSMMCKRWGMPPSRAKANIIRELLVWMMVLSNIQEERPKRRPGSYQTE